MTQSPAASLAPVKPQHLATDNAIRASASSSQPEASLRVYSADEWPSERRDIGAFAKRDDSAPEAGVVRRFMDRWIGRETRDER